MFDKASWTAGTFHPVITMKRAHDKMQAVGGDLSTSMFDNMDFNLAETLDHFKPFQIFEPWSDLSTHSQMAMDSFVTNYYYVLENFLSMNVDELALAAISMLDDFQREWIIKAKEYLDEKYLGKDIRIGITEDEARELGCFITNVCLAVKAIEAHKTVDEKIKKHMEWRASNPVNSPRPTCLAEMDNFDLINMAPFLSHNTEPDPQQGGSLASLIPFVVDKENGLKGKTMMAHVPQHEPVQPMTGVTRSIYPVRDPADTSYSTTTFTIDYGGLKVVTDSTVDSSDPTNSQGDNSNEAQ